MDILPQIKNIKVLNRPIVSEAAFIIATILNLFENESIGVSNIIILKYENLILKIKGIDILNLGYSFYYKKRFSLK